MEVLAQCGLGEIKCQDLGLWWVVWSTVAAAVVRSAIGEGRGGKSRELKIAASECSAKAEVYHFTSFIFLRHTRFNLMKVLEEEAERNTHTHHVDEAEDIGACEEGD